MSTLEPQISVHEALRIFRDSEVYVCLGAVITAVGLLAAAFSVLRKRFDPLLLSFALFAVLYGVRLVINQQPMWELHEGPPMLRRFSVGLGYLVPLPAFFFFRSLGLIHRIGKILITIVSPIVIAMSLLTLVTGPRHLWASINNVAITISLAVFVIELVIGRSQTPDGRTVQRGLLLFIACALYGNLTDYLPLPDVNIEPFAFVILLAALGIVAGRRTLAREQQLTVIEKELQIAQDIQLSILPGSFPASKSFQVAARYQPMTSVAGDLYEYLVTGDEAAGLLIADVSGHGVPAALIASMVKLAATSQRYHANEPAAVLKGMNDALYGNTQSQFVTAAYAYLDATAHELRYAGAGHPPVMLLRGGEVLSIEENGLMLAAFPWATYTSTTLPLEPQDRMVMYTDGLLEAASPAGEEFGEERLRRSILESRLHSVSEAAQRIVETVQRWGAAQNDDLTVIVCDYLAPTAHAVKQ